METLEELGRYRVLEPIGRGGMGTVFAGHHVVLERPVAIKVLHPHLVAESAMARRILDEARTIAGLQHPGIVEVLDVGRADDGRTYVVMERLVGESLGDRLQRGRLTEERSVAFARQLASALAVAHAAGVVHRDLKPDNIFIVPDPDIAGGERVKILDFGIAKRIVTDFGREQTQTGVVLGTPAYMAPEQCTGSSRLDGRADIYALGIVIYLMVTGELPFDGASTEEIFAEHVFCAPRPPAALAPVTARLAVVIDRCLAKRPEDRFTSMDALALELESLQGESPSAPPAQASTEVATASARTETALPTLSRTIGTPRPRSARADTEPARASWVHGALLTISAIAVGVAAALVVRAAAGSGEVSASPVRAPMASPRPIEAEVVSSELVEPRRERRLRERAAREDQARVVREVRARRDRPDGGEPSASRIRSAKEERRRERAQKNERSAQDERRRDRPERAGRADKNERGDEPRRAPEKTRFADVAPPTLY